MSLTNPNSSRVRQHSSLLERFRFSRQTVILFFNKCTTLWLMCRRRILSQCSRQFQQSKFHPTAYWRYVDDIWGLWEHGTEELQNFHNLANNLHPRIKTELRYSKENIEFLDVNVTIKDGMIFTDLYTKSTDKHQCVFYGLPGSACTYRRDR